MRLNLILFLILFVLTFLPIFFVVLIVNQVSYHLCFSLKCLDAALLKVLVRSFFYNSIMLYILFIPAIFEVDYKTDLLDRKDNPNPKGCLMWILFFIIIPSIFYKNIYRLPECVTYERYQKPYEYNDCRVVKNRLASRHFLLGYVLFPNTNELKFIEEYKKTKAEENDLD